MTALVASTMGACQLALRVAPVALMALAGCARAVQTADPPVPRAEAQLRRIDELLQAAGRAPRGAARERLGQQALDEITRRLRASPEDAELHLLSARAWMILADARAAGSAEPEAAAARSAHAALDEAERLDKGGGRAEDISVERGVLLSKQGRIAEALAAYGRALALHALAGPYATGGDPLEHPAGRAALLYGNAADSLMALGRLPEAISYYRLALEHTPRDADSLLAMPHFGLAVALDRDGQEERARAELRLALARDPDLAELDDENVFFVPACDKDYYLGLGELGRGHPAEADAAFRRYLAVTPTPPWVTRARTHLEEIRLWFLRAGGSAAKPAGP